MNTNNPAKPGTDGFFRSMGGSWASPHEDSCYAGTPSTLGKTRGGPHFGVGFRVYINHREGTR